MPNGMFSIVEYDRETRDFVPASGYTEGQLARLLRPIEEVAAIGKQELLKNVNLKPPVTLEKKIITHSESNTATGNS